MSSHNIYAREALPFTPLPDNAFHAAHDSMLNLGFASEAILESYRIHMLRLILSQIDHRLIF